MTSRTRDPQLLPASPPLLPSKCSKAPLPGSSTAWLGREQLGGRQRGGGGRVAKARAPTPPDVLLQPPALGLQRLHLGLQLHLACPKLLKESSQLSG